LFCDTVKDAQYRLGIAMRVDEQKHHHESRQGIRSSHKTSSCGSIFTRDSYASRALAMA